MSLDSAANFVSVQASTGYSSSDTAITLQSGQGAKIPTPPCQLVWYNSTDYPNPANDPNVEIVRVTAVITDTLTITRGQEGTSAANHNTSGKTYSLVLGITAKMITDIGTALASTVPTSRTVNGHALSDDVTVSANDVLPSQTGNSGKFLTTDGTNASWGSAGSGSGTVTDVTSNDGSITVTDGTTTPDLSVVSAPKLTTARTIDGESFDGSANITVIAPGTHAATSKTTPADDDELPITDSAASYVLKKLTWSNLLSALNSIYQTALGYTPAHSGSNSDITSLSGLTTALSVGQGGTGATTLTGVLIGNGTSAVTAVTAPAGTIVGTSDTQTLSNKTFTKPTVNGSVPAVTSDTDGSTITFDLSASNIHTVTLGGNRTLALSNASTGQVFMIELFQDSTGSRTVTWFTTIRWAGGTAPTLTTTASKKDTFGFRCTGSGTYDGYVIGQNL